MSSPETPESLGDEVLRISAAAGISLPVNTVRTLARYASLVVEASRDTNLTAFRSGEAFLREGVFQALSLLPFATGTGPILDVGSGAGLPGVVWAIAEPERAVTLTDMRPLRVAFLERVVRELGLRVEVIRGRAEVLARTPRRESFAVAVARAVGPLPYLAEVMLPLLSTGGRGICPKGPSQEDEAMRAEPIVKALGGKLTIVPEPPVLGERRAGFVALFDKQGLTPPSFPRGARRLGAALGQKV